MYYRHISVHVLLLLLFGRHGWTRSRREDQKKNKRYMYVSKKTLARNCVDREMRIVFTLSAPRNLYNTRISLNRRVTYILEPTVYPKSEFKQ